MCPINVIENRDPGVIHETIFQFLVNKILFCGEDTGN